jgi:hypothetical protein
LPHDCRFSRFAVTRNSPSRCCVVDRRFHRFFWHSHISASHLPSLFLVLDRAHSRARAEPGRKAAAGSLNALPETGLAVVLESRLVLFQNRQTGFGTQAVNPCHSVILRESGLKQFSKAEAILAESLRLKESHNTRIALALAYLSQGKVTKAENVHLEAGRADSWRTWSDARSPDRIPGQ